MKFGILSLKRLISGASEIILYQVLAGEGHVPSGLQVLNQLSTLSITTLTTTLLCLGRARNV